MNDTPNEIILEILRYLDKSDPGIFALSTSCKRLHYLALPIYLAGHGIPNSTSLASEDLIIHADELDILAALETALFIPSLQHISCSFALSSARYGYSALDMDVFIRHIRRLANFLLTRENVGEVTLIFKDLNIWAVDESTGVLETWSAAISRLLDVILEKQCKTLTVDGGMFIVHPTQLKEAFTLAEPPTKWRVMASDASRLLWKASETIAGGGKPRMGPETFNIHSRLLLLRPCFRWTMAALSRSSNLTTLSLAQVDIPEYRYDEILSSIRIPALRHLIIDLRCKLNPGPLSQFLSRHPLIITLSLGHELAALLHDDLALSDCLPNLTTLSASPSYVRFLMTGKRSPSVHSVSLLLHVTHSATFKAHAINTYLESCHTRLQKLPMHLSLIITINHASSLWTGFFPEVDRSPQLSSNSLELVRVLEVIVSSPCGWDTFAEMLARWLPTFPKLISASFSGCAKNAPPNMHPLVAQIKQACPEIQIVTIDGKASHP
ncbi:hypothetical protein C8J57DRAFT_1289097 [Mycena rebaudengoi]|nr:hypothetical protein C8J57DRAFT_1289097 [Mycena rebaudengoi]